MCDKSLFLVSIQNFISYFKGMEFIVPCSIFFWEIYTFMYCQYLTFFVNAMVINFKKGKESSNIIL